jgi:hypothetical protein
MPGRKNRNAIVICKVCYENIHQPFANAVNKQSFKQLPGKNIRVTFSNWIRHLKDAHSIEGPTAGVKAQQEATLARAELNKTKNPFMTQVIKTGKKNTVAAFHLLLARTVTDMGLPDCAVENSKFRNLLNFCVTRGATLKQAGDSVLLGRQKLGTIRKQDLLHSFMCIRGAINGIRDFFTKRYGTCNIPFAVALCDHLDKPEDILGVSLILLNPRTWKSHYFALCLLPSKGRVLS